MKKLLTSYRWRRRFAWLTGFAVLAAGIVAVIVLWPDLPREQRGPSNVQARIEKEPKAVRLKKPDEKGALKVVQQFVYTAVVRKHVERSFALVAPELREGFTREQWATQDIPIVPFPAQSARWRLEYSDQDGVGFSVALFPTPDSHQRAQVFLVGLHMIGAVKHRHWVVDNWQAAPGRGFQPVSGGGGGSSSGNILGGASSAVDRVGNSSESAAWLLLPLGLLSLAIFVPLAVGGVNWYRGHRAARAIYRS